MTFWLSWVIGGLVVVATSYGRFNTPPTSRSSTTWARYHALAFVYTLALLASWIVLANTPALLRVLGQTQGADWLQDLDVPLYAAVILTVVVGVRPLVAFDTKVRALLQNLARIPWEVQRLSAALRARTWLPDGTFQEDIRTTLRRAGFADADMSFSSDRTPQALWTRITALRKYIETWETRQGKFSGFYFANHGAISDIDREYENLRETARRVFPMFEAARTPGGDATSDSIQRELAGGFMIAAARLEKDLCDLVSRAVLTCGLTERARRAEFETIGFMVNVTPSRLFDNMLGLYLCLTAIYVVVMTIAQRPRPWLSGPVIATIYVGAVLVALLLKRARWTTHLPIARYASSAAAAFAFASGTSLVLGVLMTFDVAKAWQLLASRWWPWGFMSANLAALVAYRMDQEERPGIRRQEAATVALACMLAAIPVVWLLATACGQPACDSPPLARVMITAGLTGALIGYFVPTWYRRPEVMVSGYGRHKIIVTVRTAESAIATIDVLQPKPPRGPRPAAVRLPDEIESASADDAIAEAIRTARAWIDGGMPSASCLDALRLGPPPTPGPGTGHPPPAVEVHEQMHPPHA